MTGPQPRTDALNPIAQGLLAGDGPFEAGQPVCLAASHCISCDRYEFPLRDRCPACGASMVDAQLGGTATVAGHTAVAYPPPGSQVEAPYTVVCAAFPEGISALGLGVGAAHEDVVIGDVVDTVVVDVGGQASFGFRPTGGRDLTGGMRTDAD